MATIITRTLLCLVFGLAFVGCKPQSQMLVREWPFAETNKVVAFKKVTRTTPAGQLQTGISLSAKERLNYAIAYGNHSPGRNQVQPDTNTIVWLDEKGEYAFLTRGEMVQGASMKLGSIDHKPVIIQIEQTVGGFFRTQHMLQVENEMSKELTDHSTLQKLNEPEIEKLIQNLHSPNLDAAVFGWPSDIPVNYDVERQKQVWRAENTLNRLGFKAFPLLISHINNIAYCKTVLGGELVSYSVGDTCVSIINQQINVAGYPHRFQDRKGMNGMWGSPYFWASRENIEGWWETNKHRSLEEVQLDSVNYVISKEKELGFISPEQEKKVLEPLEEIRQRLLKKIADNANR